MNMIESVLADEDLPDKHRRYWEKALAKEYYLLYGKLLESTTDQGEKKIYQPTQEDIDFKNKYDSTYSLMGWIMSGLRNAMVLWASVIVFGMLIGLFLPMRKQVNMNET